MPRIRRQEGQRGRSAEQRQIGRQVERQRRGVEVSFRSERSCKQAHGMAWQVRQAELFWGWKWQHSTTYSCQWPVSESCMRPAIIVHRIGSQPLTTFMQVQMNRCTSPHMYIRLHNSSCTNLFIYLVTIFISVSRLRQVGGRSNAI
jgi:hypothetical protein